MKKYLLCFLNVATFVTMGYIASAFLAPTISAQEPTDMVIASGTSSIIGGELATEGAWPWMAGLVVSGYTSLSKRVYCGGVLIDEQWVLTAAHCTIRNNEELAPEDIDVVLGANDLTSETIIRLQVVQIVRHPAYFDSVSGHADVALLKLSEATEITPLTIANPKLSRVETVGKLATALGWGKTGQETRVNELRQVALPLVSNETCNGSYSPIGYTISENMICAGFQAGGKDSCFGDSGGPLVSYDEESESWVHIGIISWGKGCAQKDYYGVYTRTSQFHQWITDYMSGASNPEEPGAGPSGQGMTKMLIYMPLVRN